MMPLEAMQLARRRAATFRAESRTMAAHDAAARVAFDRAKANVRSVLGFAFREYHKADVDEWMCDGLYAAAEYLDEALRHRRARDVLRWRINWGIEAAVSGEIVTR